jgi:hypothetical protein
MEGGSRLSSSHSIWQAKANSITTKCANEKPAPQLRTECPERLASLRAPWSGLDCCLTIKRQERSVCSIADKLLTIEEKIMSKYCLSLLLGLLGAGWFLLGDAHAADGMDPCKMMQKTDVEAAFAPHKFDDGSLSQTMKGSAKLAAVSECIYTSKGASIKEQLSVSLLMRRANGCHGHVTSASADGCGETQRHASRCERAGGGRVLG